MIKNPHGLFTATNILAAIERIAKGVALTAGVPAHLAPIVKVGAVNAPATYNDPALTARLGAVLEKALGTNSVSKAPPVMGSEDFGYFGLDDNKIPSFYFYVGVYAPAQVAESLKTGTQLPSNHSSLFAPPNPEPTLKTAVKAMTAVVLDVMKK